MTRCKAFYRKVKELDTKESILKFCGRKDNTVYKIKAHIEYMDRHFPGWDQEETECTIVQLSEGNTRYLRKVERKDELLHEMVLDDLIEMTHRPTAKDIRDLIRYRDRNPRNYDLNDDDDEEDCTGYFETCDNTLCQCKILQSLGREAIQQLNPDMILPECEEEEIEQHCREEPSTP